VEIPSAVMGGLQKKKVRQRFRPKLSINKTCVDKRKALQTCVLKRIILHTSNILNMHIYNKHMYEDLQHNYSM